MPQMELIVGADYRTEQEKAATAPSGVGEQPAVEE